MAASSLAATASGKMYKHAIRSSKWGVRMVQCLNDNYAYLLIDKEKKVAAAVDAVEPAKVVAAAKEEGVSIVSVLTTHNHWDHAGGNEELKNMLGKGVPFIAGKGEDVPEQTREVVEG